MARTAEEILKTISIEVQELVENHDSWLLGMTFILQGAVLMSLLRQQGLRSSTDISVVLSEALRLAFKERDPSLPPVTVGIMDEHGIIHVRQ